MDANHLMPNQEKDELELRERRADPEDNAIVAARRIELHSLPDPLPTKILSKRWQVDACLGDTGICRRKMQPSAL